jgi:hypothetical protein
MPTTSNRTFHFRVDIKPLEWVEANDFKALHERLAQDESPLEIKGLNVWYARHQWQLEMPLGLFANNFRPGAITWPDELAARDALFATMRPRRFRQSDIIEREGVTYYRKPVLEQVQAYHEQPAMIRALLAFWHAAEKDRALIKPPAPKKPHLEPWERKQRFGVECRGPSWTPGEDAVLRQWFGRRTVGPHTGRHTYLTEHEWNVVLDALGRRRSQASVRQRLVVLNDRLRQEFVDRRYISNGFLGAKHQEEWLNRVLGERPRPLPVRTMKRAA